MSQGNIQNPHTSLTNFSPKLIDKFKRFGRMKFKETVENKEVYLFFIKICQICVFHTNQIHVQKI